MPTGRPGPLRSRLTSLVLFTNSLAFDTESHHVAQAGPECMTALVLYATVPG